MSKQRLSESRTGNAALSTRRRWTVTALTRWPESSALDPHEIEFVRGWHCVGDSGAWDTEALYSELSASLVHSHWRGAPPGKAKLSRNCRHLVFAKDNGLLVAVSHHAPGCRTLRVWARDPEETEAEFARLRVRYFRQQCHDDENAQFFLLTVKLSDLETRIVRTKPVTQTSEDLTLHYGDDFEKWHRQFVAELTSRGNGLTILQGPPGTGKTTYLRHLLYELRKTHCFYYLPLPVCSDLSSPFSVDFWIGENERHKGLTNVVVMEDAEAILAERHEQNQESLSSLLNIGDGFLGDFLRLHVICTINAPISRLDPAVKRSGRLIAARRFQRLTWPQAQRLADARGLALEFQESYSLAEIYTSSRLTRQLSEECERKVGFAASINVYANQ
jgi:hypothetical protein